MERTEIQRKTRCLHLILPDLNWLIISNTVHTRSYIIHIYHTCNFSYSALIGKWKPAERRVLLIINPQWQRIDCVQQYKCRKAQMNTQLYVSVALSRVHTLFFYSTFLDSYSFCVHEQQTRLDFVWQRFIIVAVCCDASRNHYVGHSCGITDKEMGWGEK